MKEATALMLRCSQMESPQRQQYNRTHKRMVRLLREWSALEQFREHESPEPHPPLETTAGLEDEIK